MADAPTPLDPNLAAYLAERDEPCPACNYNLRGLKTDRCPECNRELIIQIRLAEPRLGTWIASLAAAAAMLGFNVLILCFYLSELLQGRLSGSDFREMRPLVVFSIVAGVLLALLIVLRRRFCAQPLGVRLGLAIALWATTLWSASIFFSQVR